MAEPSTVFWPLKRLRRFDQPREHAAGRDADHTAHRDVDRKASSRNDRQAASAGARGSSGRGFGRRFRAGSWAARSWASASIKERPTPVKAAQAAFCFWMRRLKPRLGPRIDAWWDTVLAGETDEPHPIHGDEVSVRLRDGRLELSGELDTERDRDELVKQALARTGRGFREVDAADLRVADQTEKPGILDQTLVAAFSDRATAELARKLVLEHSHAAPKKETIIDRANA